VTFIIIVIVMSEHHILKYNIDVLYQISLLAC
jgi:hypothetical protein